MELEEKDNKFIYYGMQNPKEFLRKERKDVFEKKKIVKIDNNNIRYVTYQKIN